MHRTKYAVLTLWLCLAACGEEKSYAEDHRSEIRYDCEQTVTCRAGRGESLADKALESCIDKSLDRLDGYSSRKREVWEKRFERCTRFQGCTYYDCSKSDESYSMAQLAKLQHDCTARVTCSNMRGQMLPPSAIDACIVENGVMLDIGTADARVAFETRFARCSAMQACAYNDCK